MVLYFNWVFESMFSLGGKGVNLTAPPDLSFILIDITIYANDMHNFTYLLIFPTKSVHDSHIFARLIVALSTAQH